MWTFLKLGQGFFCVCVCVIFWTNRSPSVSFQNKSTLVIYIHSKVTQMYCSSKGQLCNRNLFDKTQIFLVWSCVWSCPLIIQSAEPITDVRYNTRLWCSVFPQSERQQIFAEHNLWSIRTTTADTSLLLDHSWMSSISPILEKPSLMLV